MDPVSPTPDDLRIEWEESQKAIARFDGHILDVRKFGFTIITGLLGANGLLFSVLKSSSVTALGAFSAVSVLILCNFVLDRQYEMFLRGAVANARRIESERGAKLTTTIHVTSARVEWMTWGQWFYLGFLLCDVLLFLGVAWQRLAEATAWGVALHVAVALLPVALLWLVHRKTVH